MGRLIILFSCIAIYSCSPKVIHNTETLDKSKPLQLKYSKILQQPIDSIYNLTLYKNLESWNELKDSLHYASITYPILFINFICYSQYNITLPHTHNEILKDEQVYLFKNTSYLKEGDLVFYSDSNDSKNSVGLYLRNGYFVSSSSLGKLEFYNINNSINNIMIQSNAKLYKK